MSDEEEADCIEAAALIATPDGPEVVVVNGDPDWLLLIAEHLAELLDMTLLPNPPPLSAGWLDIEGEA